MQNKCIGLLFFSLHGWCAESVSVIGDAYDPAGKQLLYQEYHYYSDDGLDHRVVYQTPQGEEMAVKTLDYRSGTTTPGFKQQSWFYPERLAVQPQDQQLLIQYEEGDKAPKQQQLVQKLPLVIDAGFDHYIRQHWPQLMTGKSLEFYFPAVTRLSLVKLRVLATACSYSTDSDSCFTINSASWLIRLLMDPIELGYDRDSQRLSRFRGLANLSDKHGKGLQVDIHYRYQQSLPIMTP